MSDNLKELLASKLNLEKPLSDLCVLSENEEIYKGLIKCSFPNSEIKKYLECSGSYIRSNWFAIGSPNYCSFRFLLYPNGRNEASKGSVSITIEFYSKLPESAWIEGALSFSGEDSKKFCTGGSTSSIDIDNVDETRRLMKVMYISADDEALIIQCSLKMKLREVKCNFDGSTIEYAESRKFNTYKESLLNHKSFSDVTFHLEGGDVKAHKAVLAKVPFFQELFESNDSEQNIELTHIKHDTFVHVLQFLYTHDIPLLDFRLASELYIVSHDFKIFDLKNICSSYFGANLTEENVFIVISLAHKYDDMLLKKTCIKFIKDCDTEKLANKSVIL